MPTDNGPSGPQCHVLRLMAKKGQLKVDSTGWGEVGGTQVSGRTVEALDERGLIASSDGGTTFTLTPEGKRWAQHTEQGMNLEDMTTEQIANACDNLKSCVQCGGYEDAVNWLTAIQWAMWRQEIKRRVQVERGIENMAKALKGERY